MTATESSQGRSLPEYRSMETDYWARGLNLAHSFTSCSRGLRFRGPVGSTGDSGSQRCIPDKTSPAPAARFRTYTTRTQNG
jgi:hypothetical protein